MLLDKRLRSVVDEIEDSACTIDVGTDHGKVILTALAEGRCRKGIASDISSASLAKARELASKMDIILDTRCGDGLSVLDEDEADTAVIAGMGGNEIVKILSSYPHKVPRLILVPHRDARGVREYLAEHGYRIERDYMVMEGTFYYPIIVAVEGEGSLTRREAYFGKSDLSDSTFRAYISYRLSVLEDIAKRTDRAEIHEELALIHEMREGEI